MKYFIVILICLTALIKLSQSDLIEDTKKHYRKGLPKLYKVFSWLVLEKDDSDRALMVEKTCNQFVDFVLKHADLCVEKDGAVDCKELRKEIDSNKDEAGTLSISFDAKMKSVGKVLGRIFGAHDADTVEPYGVLSLLEWALEFGNKKHSRLITGFPKPSNLTAMIKFIINNKNDIWGKIREGISMTEASVLKIPDVTPLQDYMMGHLMEMGWETEQPSKQQIRSALQILSRDYALMKSWGRGLF
ncbi:uncharacterized protein LOC141854103 [Brevipalpus obovatus]|uniref:uncharacterized protein LOC141854103 n=1 Tax=Brevipalpus obovatus TaxID=246614 RepID=UPI003D9E7FCE